MKFVLYFVLFILAGCAGLNDSLTPDAKVSTDPFDGTKILAQTPVSASSKLSEDWHTLGFTWRNDTPQIVYLTAGMQGVDNISNIAFNVDGEIIKRIPQASILTDYGDNTELVAWSTRRFAIHLNDFLKLSQGKDIKMKVEQIDTYTVSSFGSSNPNAQVNAKLTKFVTLLKEHGAIAN